MEESEDEKQTEALPSFSDYIIYVDESGDHSLTKIDRQYPVFVLAFCIFNKESYVGKAVPALQRLKFKHFGHDMAVLHENEIRKRKGDFRFLMDERLRARFLPDLQAFFSELDFKLIAVVIRKDQLVKDYEQPEHPYEMALKFCLERTHYFLKGEQAGNGLTHIVFESRGRKEDRDLRSAFDKVCRGSNYPGAEMPLQCEFAHKKANSCGLQIADLVARPIGRKVLKPLLPNRPYEVIERFFRRSPWNQVRGWGLKVFPEKTPK